MFNSSHQSLVDLLQQYAIDKPEKPLYTTVNASCEEDACLTYSALDKRATAIATQLLKQHAKGDRVLLIFASGLDFISGFFGCLYAGVIAVPVNLPSFSRVASLMKNIALDCEAETIVTTQKIREQLHKKQQNKEFLESFDFLEIDTLPLSDGRLEVLPGINGEDIAFLQYTSGSTGNPKGVALSHKNLMENQRMIKAAFAHDQNTVVVGWLPLFHDMGLIGNVLQPLYLGATAILLSPGDFIKNPALWLNTISRYRAATSGGPNFGFDACLGIKEERLDSNLDLSSWQLAFNGAEPVRAETMRLFSKKFASFGFNEQAFFPCYGLAETTLYVTGCVKKGQNKIFSADKKQLESNVFAPAEDSTSGVTLVSCGVPAIDSKVVIKKVTDESECLPGEIGEICVQGDHVSGGYWNNPLNLQFFSQREGQNLVRTGDKGVLYDGELYVIGRIKDLIIIRGRNFYPQDFEWLSERSSEDLQPASCIAFGVDEDGVEELVIVQEVKRTSVRKLDVADITKTIRKNISEQFLIAPKQVLLVKPGAIPKTTSGKVKRQACKKMFLSKALSIFEISASSDSSMPQKERRSDKHIPIIDDVVLCIRSVSPDIKHVAPSASLLQLGLDSLNLSRLANALEEKLNVEIELEILFTCSSIIDLAALLNDKVTSAKALSDAREPNLPVAVKGELGGVIPYSIGQKAIWMFSRITNHTDDRYWISRSVRLPIEFDESRFQHALSTVMTRHSLLAARCTEQGFEIPQNIDVLDFWHSDTYQSEVELQHKIRQFDSSNKMLLEDQPLLKIVVLDGPAAERCLLCTVHHIICDLWSLAVLFNELAEIYKELTNSLQLEAPRHYQEYVIWQKEQMLTPEKNTGLTYWINGLSEYINDAKIPANRVQTNVENTTAGYVKFTLDEALLENIKKQSSKYDVTLYMYLFAAFQISYGVFSNQKKFLLGSPFSGRSKSQFSQTFGYFINTLCLAGDLTSPQTFVELLNSVKQTVSDAIKYQDYPYYQLLQSFRETGEVAEIPLVQVLFTLQSSGGIAGSQFDSGTIAKESSNMFFADMELEFLGHKQRGLLYDFDFELVVHNRELVGELKYNTELYTADFMREFVAHFSGTIEQVVRDPTCDIHSLDHLSTDDFTKQTLYWNQDEADYSSPSKTMGDMFLQVCQEQPGKNAIISGDLELSYEELLSAARKLSYEIKQTESELPGQSFSVGIYLDSSPMFIASMLASWFAEKPFVPLEPGLPEERLAAQLKDAGAKVVITNQSLSESLSKLTELNLGIITSGSNDISHRNSLSGFQHKLTINNIEEEIEEPHFTVDTAYIIYTSGTTGKPKGVPITHKNVMPLLYWQQLHFELGHNTRTFQTLSLSFDFGLQEIFTTTLFGGCMVLPTSKSCLVPLTYMENLNANNISMIYVTPSFCAELVKTEISLRDINCILIGGEKLKWSTVAKLRELVSPDCKIFNGYGPTEASINNSMYKIPTDFADNSQLSHSVPIGKKSGMSKLFILDEHKRVVPPGVPGEVFIGGPGVCHGYTDKNSSANKCFVKLPHLANDPNEVFYQSGDIARYLSGGELEFIARKDSQHKLRGYRLDTAAIETVISSLPCVSECIVEINSTSNNGKAILAYVIADKGTTKNTLLKQIRPVLPHYMLPSDFILLKEFPLTKNGKLDRRRLPVSNIEQENKALSKGATLSEIREVIIDIVKTTFEINEVNSSQNFFDMGGHSFSISEVHAQLKTITGLQFPVTAIFDNPTVNGLTAFLKTEMSGPKKTTPSKKGVNKSLTESMPLARPTELAKAESNDRASRLKNSRKSRRARVGNRNRD